MPSSIMPNTMKFKVYHQVSIFGDDESVQEPAHIDMSTEQECNAQADSPTTSVDAVQGDNPTASVVVAHQDTTQYDGLYVEHEEAIEQVRAVNESDNTPSNSSASVEAGNSFGEKSTHVLDVHRTKRAKAQIMDNIFLKLKAAKDQHLVEDVLSKGETTIFYGKPGCGKSFIAIDLSMSIANSSNWHDQKAKSGNVLYLCGEGEISFFQRIIAWNTHYQAPISNRFRFITTTFSLNDANKVNDIILDMQDEQFMPDLVVVDTLARWFTGNENSSQDMGQFISNLAKLQKGLNDCAVLILHHATKGESGGIRGSSALHGAVDVVYQLSKGEGVTGAITMKNEKARNSEPRKFKLSLEQQYITYEYTTDDDQIGLKTVKSAIPVMVSSNESPESLPATAPKEKAVSKVDKAKAIILGLLEEGEGEVSAKDVYAACKDAGITDSTVRDAKTKLSIKSRKSDSGTDEWYVM